MQCSACGESNPEQAQFCIECGSSLAAVTGATTRLPVKRCSGCDQQTAAAAAFCPFCGRSFNAAPASQAARPAASAAPTPAAPIPASRPRHSRNGDPTLVLLAVGLFLTVVMLSQRALFPGLLVLAGGGLFWRNMQRRRYGHGLGLLILLGGLALLLLHGHFWPGIWVVLLLAWLIRKIF